jgi:hypothetical protein
MKKPIIDLDKISSRSENRGRRFHKTEKQQMIVLVDGAGNYYELPRAVLERSRVKEHRKAKVAAALQDVPSEFAYIGNPHIPGGIAKAAQFMGGRQLHYGGFYVSSTKSKR